MSSEEQKQILKMVEDGKISAEEALKLIQALESSCSRRRDCWGSCIGFRISFGIGRTRSARVRRDCGQSAPPVADSVVDRCFCRRPFGVLAVYIGQCLELWILVLLCPASFLVRCIIAGVVYRQPDIALVICECGTSRTMSGRTTSRLGFHCLSGWPVGFSEILGKILKA